MKSVIDESISETNMSRYKLKQRAGLVTKLSLILVVLAGLSGCRELSDLLDPARNAPKRQLKTVKRDKPNLAEDTTPREVDPDSADLVEATDEQIAEDLANQPKTTDVAPPTDTNSAEPNAEFAMIEQKAKALVGRWEPANNPDGVIFEFTVSKREGDTFVGTFNFYVNGDRDLPSQYTVSRDDLIKLVQDGVTSKIKCDISGDGNSMKFTNQDGEVSDLRRTNAQPTKQQETPNKRQEQPQPKAQRPEVYQ